MRNYNIIKTLNLSKEKRRDFNKLFQNAGNNNNEKKSTEIIHHNVVPTMFHVNDNPKLAYEYFEKIYKYYKSVEKFREQYPNGIIDNHYTDIYIYSTFAEQFFVTAIDFDGNYIQLFRIIQFSKNTKPDTEDETEYNCFKISTTENPFGYDGMGLIINLYEDGYVDLEFNA